MNNKLEHSPEPWILHRKYLPQRWEILDADGDIIAILPFSLPKWKAEKDAERMIACAKACKGIPNKWLEDTETDEKKITRKLFDEFRKLEEDAKKQKDLIDEIYFTLVRQLSEPIDQDTGVMLSICTKIEESRKCH